MFMPCKVCGRPCVRFMHGNCEQGAACQYCHLEHTRPWRGTETWRAVCATLRSHRRVIAGTWESGEIWEQGRALVRPKLKLDKRQRQCLDSLNEQQALRVPGVWR